jgi:hypothetical protein
MQNEFDKRYKDLLEAIREGRKYCADHPQDSEFKEFLKTTIIETLKELRAIQAKAKK